MDLSYIFRIPFYIIETVCTFFIYNYFNLISFSTTCAVRMLFIFFYNIHEVTNHFHTVKEIFSLYINLKCSHFKINVRHFFNQK